MVEPKLMAGCATRRYVYDTSSSVTVLPDHQHTLKMWMELVPKMLENLHILTQLPARENLIEFCGHETFSICSKYNRYNGPQQRLKCQPVRV